MRASVQHDYKGASRLSRHCRYCASSHCRQPQHRNASKLPSRLLPSSRCRRDPVQSADSPTSLTSKIQQPHRYLGAIKFWVSPPAILLGGFPYLVNTRYTQYCNRTLWEWYGRHHSDLWEIMQSLVSVFSAPETTVRSQTALLEGSMTPRVGHRARPRRGSLDRVHRATPVSMVETSPPRKWLRWSGPVWSWCNPQVGKICGESFRDATKSTTEEYQTATSWAICGKKHCKS